MHFFGKFGALPSRGLAPLLQVYRGSSVNEGLEVGGASVFLSNCEKLKNEMRPTGSLAPLLENWLRNKVKSYRLQVCSSAIS